VRLIVSLFRFPLFALMLYAGLIPISAAQPAGAEGENFLYRVRSGDTLIALSQTYTDNPSNWQALQSHNQINDQFSVPIGRLLKIPFALIPVLPSQATVGHLSGTVYENGGRLLAGATIAEGSTVRTDADGFATLNLEDGSDISIPAQSVLTVSRLRAFKNTGLIDAIITVDEGGLEAQVAPEQTGVGRFEIRAPVSVTGVRGTRLRVRVSPQGSQTELLSGAAQLDTKQNNHAALSANQGAAIDTEGRLLGVRTLLPAPKLSEPVRGGSGWMITAQPVEQAVAYLVRVSRDEEGTNLVYSKLFDTPEVSFNGRTSGQHYVFVRAVDKDGVMGQDASLAFESIVGLQTASGVSVLTGFGDPVLLTEY
jgi:hypothetical protein